MNKIIDVLRGRRRVLLSVAAVVLLLAALPTAVLLAADGPREQDGPVGQPGAHGVGSWERVGTLIVSGTAFVYNQGKKPAILERVELIDPPSALKLIDIKVAGPNARLPPLDPFGPENRVDLHPVKGYKVMPRSSKAGRKPIGLATIMRAKKRGRHLGKGYRLYYRVGSKRYVSFIDSRFLVCAYKGKLREDPGVCGGPGLG